MSPRLAANKVDYNLAMDPALLNAGKIVAAAEDRSLAVLIRHLLRQHIERNGNEEAQQVYSTGAQIPHGTRIDRFGKPKEVSVQLPGDLYERAQALAHWEERSMTSLMRQALERYLEASKVASESQDPIDPDVDDVPRNNRGDPMDF